MRVACTLPLNKPIEQLELTRIITYKLQLQHCHNYLLVFPLLNAAITASIQGTQTARNGKKKRNQSADDVILKRPKQLAVELKEGIFV